MVHLETDICLDQVNRDHTRISPKIEPSRNWVRWVEQRITATQLTPFLGRASKKKKKKKKEEDEEEDNEKRKAYKFTRSVLSAVDLLYV